MKVKLLIEGGKMAPGPAVAQQLGPMGINLGKVISDVNEATAGFKGLKVPVELDVDPATKSYEIQVFSPPVAELLKNETGAEKGSGEPHKVKVGNLAIENIISVAKTKKQDLLAKDLKSAVKLVLGTCVSSGILVESKSPKDIIADVNAGIYDSQISSQSTEVSEEKKAELKSYFTQIKSQQEKVKKAEEEAAKAAEEAKNAAAASAPAVVASTPAKDAKK